MKKRILSSLLALAMVLALLPAAALAAEEAADAPLDFAEPAYLATAEEPSVDGSGDGWTWRSVWQEEQAVNTLTLNQLTLNIPEKEATAVSLPESTTVVLEGANSIQVPGDGSVGLWGLGDLALVGSGSLSITGYQGIGAYGAVSITGCAVTIDAQFYGIAPNGAVTISGSDVTIAAGGNGIATKAEVSIQNHAKVAIDAQFNAIEASGSVAIQDSQVEIQAQSDGIYAELQVTIQDSTVTMDTGYAGISLADGQVALSGTSRVIAPYIRCAEAEIGEDVTLQTILEITTEELGAELRVYGAATVSSTMRTDGHPYSALIVREDATLILPKGQLLDISAAVEEGQLVVDGQLALEGLLILPAQLQLEALAGKLSGGGFVKLGDAIHSATPGGAGLHSLESLNLLDQEDDVAGKGYSWAADTEGGYTLTLENVYLSRNQEDVALQLPAQPVRIVTRGTVLVDGGVQLATGAAVSVEGPAALWVYGPVTTPEPEEEGIPAEVRSTISITGTLLVTGMKLYDCDLTLSGNGQLGASIDDFDIVLFAGTLTLSGNAHLELVGEKGGVALIQSRLIRTEAASISAPIAAVHVVEGTPPAWEEIFQLGDADLHGAVPGQFQMDEAWYYSFFPEGSEPSEETMLPMVTITPRATQPDNSGGGSGPTSTTETTHNPDGSTTTTVTRPDGTVIETVRQPDGTKTETTTTQKKQSDGSVVKTETVLQTDKDGNTTASATVTSDTKTGNVTVPAEVLTQISKTPGATLTVELPGATLVFDDAAIAAIVASGGKAPALTITPVAFRDLPERAQAQLTEAATYGFSVNGGGIDFGAGKVTVTLDYTRKESTTAIVVYHVADDGSLTRVHGATFSAGQVRFETSHWSIFAVTEETPPFTDVATTAWYYNAVADVHQRGLMNGTGQHRFSPDASTTRAMLFTVLARLEGQEGSGGQTWYSQAMAWAVDNGITDGSNPLGEITRQQLATMLYRHAGSPAAPNLALTFADAAQVSPWAADALRWAVDKGIVDGKGENILDPQGSATRAEVAAMLLRYLTQAADQ